MGELPCILFNIPDGKQANIPAAATTATTAATAHPKTPQKSVPVQKTPKVRRQP